MATSADGTGTVRPSVTALAQAHLDVVDWVARHFSRGRPDGDDIRQAGYVGLMKAAVSFDPSRAVQFKTYAAHVVSGEIRHYLRDRAALVRRPRGKRPPFRVLWLDDDHGGAAPPRTPVAGELASPAPTEDRVAVWQALARLPKRHRRVLYYLFFEDLTQAETGEILGVTQRHVSRLLQQALNSLRRILTDRS